MVDFGVLASLKAWMEAGQDAQQRIARDVAGMLPAPFKYSELASYQYAGVRRVVARYEYGNRTFALLPGIHDVALGYDPDRLVIDAAARQILAEEMSHLKSQFRSDEFHGSLDKLLEAFRERLLTEVSPRRRVSLSPFLVDETAAQSATSTNANAIEAQLEHGFRLPTEDEWEYACGAGSDAFFKWGERMPCEARPPGNDPPLEGEIFPDAIAQNAFGLTIAHDPYHWEFCGTPDVYRGGDGGESWCGGDGTLAIWRALGTPYRHVVKPREILNPFTRKQQTIGTDREARIRRVFPLDRS